MEPFVHLRSTGAEINNFNKNGQRTMTYDWRDLNGNRNYDPGEVNLNPNGPDFRSGGAQLNAFLNPDENIPGAEEYSIGFERQLYADCRGSRQRRLSQELQRQPEPEPPETV